MAPSTSRIELDEESLSILQNILQTASKKAAGSISKMLGTEVSTEIIDIHTDPVDLLEKEFKGTKSGIILYSELKKGEGGDSIFYMEKDKAGKLARVLLGTEDHTGELSGEEKSALREVGNILIGNFLTQLADHFDIPILHTPPVLKEKDMMDELENVLNTDRSEKDAIVAHIKLIAKGLDFDGSFVLFPSDELTEDMMENMV